MIGSIFLLFSPMALSQSTERLSLQQAIEIARGLNPDILRAQREVHAAHGRILQAGKIASPEIGISWNETPSSFNISKADERDIGITQQIEFPTKRTNRIAVAGHDKQIAELGLERIETIVTARVKTAYSRLVFSKEIVGSLEEQAMLLQDFLELANARLKAGAGTYLDVIRSKVELARLNNDLAEARREVQARRVQVNLLLGRESDQAFEPSDSLSYIPMPFGRDTLLKLLTRKSALLKIAQRSVARQQTSVRLAQTSYLPDFSLGLFHQRRAEEPPFNANQFTGTANSSIGIQVGVSFPLWFWQEPRGLVQEASALADIAQLNLRATERRVRANIINALDLVAVAESQVKVFDTSLLADAKDILLTGITQYQNNQVDALNLLDVYRTYRGTRTEYARALLSYSNAVAELEASADLPAAQGGLSLEE
jgi:cobalt-zinc-cadmium efflux system outer membrane protein